MSIPFSKKLFKMLNFNLKRDKIKLKFAKNKKGNICLTKKLLTMLMCVEKLF